MPDKDTTRNGGCNRRRKITSRTLAPRSHLSKRFAHRACPPCCDCLPLLVRHVNAEGGQSRDKPSHRYDEGPVQLFRVLTCGVLIGNQCLCVRWDLVNLGYMMLLACPYLVSVGVLLAHAPDTLTCTLLQVQRRDLLLEPLDESSAVLCLSCAFDFSDWMLCALAPHPPACHHMLRRRECRTHANQITCGSECNAEGPSSCTRLLKRLLPEARDIRQGELKSPKPGSC